jgi:hypothetical protein
MVNLPSVLAIGYEGQRNELKRRRNKKDKPLYKLR